MPNLTWLAQLVFFGSYFIAWCLNQIPHTGWLDASAIAAVVIAACLLFFDAYPYVAKRTPPVA